MFFFFFGGGELHVFANTVLVFLEAYLCVLDPFG